MFDNRKKVSQRQRKGQSTVEYIVLVTAVIGTAIAFLIAPSSPFKNKVNAVMTTSTEQMKTTMDNWKTSTDATPASKTSNPSQVTVDPTVGSVFSPDVSGGSTRPVGLPGGKTGS